MLASLIHRTKHKDAWRPSARQEVDGKTNHAVSTRACMQPEARRAGGRSDHFVTIYLLCDALTESLFLHTFLHQTRRRGKKQNILPISTLLFSRGQIQGCLIPEVIRTGGRENSFHPASLALQVTFRV